MRQQNRVHHIQIIPHVETRASRSHYRTRDKDGTALLPRLLRTATAGLLRQGAPAAAQSRCLSSAQKTLGAAIQERYACKAFLPDAVPDKTLQEILKLTLVRRLLHLATI